MLSPLSILLRVLGFAESLKVTLPASGNTWDLTKVPAYNVAWESDKSSGISHVHVALHDSAGNIVESFEKVDANLGSYWISGLFNVPGGTGYQIVLSDASTPKRKILARSGKFAIRQAADASSSGINDDPATATISAPSSAAQSLASVIASATSDFPASSAASLASSSSLTDETSSSMSTPTQTSSTPQSSTSPSPTQATTSQAATSDRTLSNGAIAGIAVSIAILALLIVGAAFWFWRRRNARTASTGNDGTTTPTAYHGKPELAGSEALIHTQKSSEKPELENNIRPTITSASTSPSAELHDQSITELSPEAAAARMVHEAPASLNPHNAQTTAYNHPTLPPGLAELPTNVSRQTSMTEPAKSATNPSKNIPRKAPSSSQRAPSDFGTSSSATTYQVSEAKEGDGDSIDALRQRERELADSISAAEHLARLKSEQRLVQERIKQAEMERTRSAQNG